MWLSALHTSREGVDLLSDRVKGRLAGTAYRGSFQRLELRRIGEAEVGRDLARPEELRVVSDTQKYKRRRKCQNVKVKPKTEQLPKKNPEIKK